MADIDPYSALGQSPLPSRQGPVLGAPAPRYNPAGFMGIDDPGMNMALTMYMPQIMNMLGVRGGQFLPEQLPAQQLMDQMTSAKYMQANRAAMAAFAPRDQNAIFNRLVGAQQKSGSGPLSGLGASHLNNFAGMLNSPLGQMISGSLIGAQNTEDLFYGRRGSATQLAASVGQFGFYRPDSVDGTAGMSADSLQQFTDQLYGNLYGPKANLNDISGLSAGRIGTVANDLAQRGLLPASLSMLPESRRMSEMRMPQNRPPDFQENIARDLAESRFMASQERFGPPGAEKTYAQLTPDERREFLDARMREKDPAKQHDIVRESMAKAEDVVKRIDAPDSTSDEIRQMEGGGSAIRRVDATRVGNALKEYSGAVDAVRSIFGDNGMGNAPMQQLMAALDSLTQGGMASMGAGKLENIMRRTQMASRDAGVSLEALMGLTARGGALADQNGLVRDVVPGQVIATMERGAAMRDSDAFRPGFGKVDPNSAMLRVMDQNARADSSNAARLASVARRIVKENEGNDEFKNRAGDLRAFVAAMERGDSTFTNSSGQVVNINEQMGKNSGAFFNDLFTRGGITDAEVSSRFYDEVNTQEYLIPGFTAAAQRYEVKQQLSGFFSQDFLGTRGEKMAQGDREKLSAAMGAAFSGAMIDEVDTNLSPAARVEVLQRSLRRGAANYLRQQGVADDQIEAATDELLFGQNGAGGIFKDQADMRRYAETQQANLGKNFEAETGQNINAFRQMNSIDVLARQEQKRRQHIARADMLATMGGGAGGDGSNILQRFSDFFLTGGRREDGSQASFAEYVLGTVETSEQQERLVQAAGGKEQFQATMDLVDNATREATVDTAAEKDALVASVLSGGPAAFADIKDRFNRQGSRLLDGADSAISTQQLAANLDKAGRDDDLKAIYGKYFKNKDGNALSQDELDAAFTGSNRAATMTALAQMDTLETQLQEIGSFTPKQMQALGLVDDKGGSVIRESTLRKTLDSAHVLAGKDPAEVAANAEKMKNAQEMSKQMLRGKLETGTIMQITGVDAQNAGVKTALDAALADGGDDAALSALDSELGKTGVDADKRKAVMSLARIHHTMQATGGLDVMSGQTTKEKMEAAARTTALGDAVKAGTIAKDSSIGKLFDTLQNPAATDAEKAAARKDLEKITESEDTFKDALQNKDKTGATLAGGAVDSIIKNAKDLGGQLTSAASAGGDMVSQIGTAISSALGKFATDMLKDVKIENVTITNLKLPNLLGGLAAAFSGGGEAPTTATPTPPKKAADPAAAGAAAPEDTTQAPDANWTKIGAGLLDQFKTIANNAMTAGGSGGDADKELTVTGTLTLNGLNKVAAELGIRGMEPTPGNSAPVMPSALAGVGR